MAQERASEPGRKLTTLSVLISILSNTFARIDAVCTLNLLVLVDPTDPNVEHRTPAERWVVSCRRTSVHPHSFTRFPLLVSLSIRYDHDRRVSAESHAIVPFGAKALKYIRSKSDALFSYQPPFNLLAFLVLWPLSCVLSPRKLHSVNVFMIKLTVSVPDDFPLDPSDLTTLIRHYIQFGPPTPFIDIDGIWE